MSEFELSLFRQRSQEALRQKARRGALVLGVAAGYVKVGRDRIEKNPDERVQAAIQFVFTKFAELQSARQVHIWLRDEGIELPAKSRRGEAHGVVWRLPAYNIVHTRPRQLSGNWNSPCSGPAMRLPMPVGSTMLLIQPIGSSPANWSADGTRLCKRLPRSRATSRP